MQLAIFRDSGAVVGVHLFQLQAASSSPYDSHNSNSRQVNAAALLTCVWTNGSVFAIFQLINEILVHFTL